MIHDDSPESEHSASLDRLLLEYWRPLVAYAQRLLGDSAAAEDVVQRAFVRLWEKKHELPTGAAARPFLYRVVRNLASNEWRRERNLDVWLDEQRYDEDDVVLPDRRMEQLELRAAIEVAVEHLPRRRREIFVLSRFHELTNDEIASVLSISPQTVANQLVSALRTLRELLRAHHDVRAPASLSIVRAGARSAG